VTPGLWDGLRGGVASWGPKARRAALPRVPPSVHSVTGPDGERGRHVGFL
jgi:hypothetical protein